MKSTTIEVKNEEDEKRDVGVYEANGGIVFAEHFWVKLADLKSIIKFFEKKRVKK